jgi:hypothetical protein
MKTWNWEITEMNWNEDLMFGLLRTLVSGAFGVTCSAVSKFIQTNKKSNLESIPEMCTMRIEGICFTVPC